MAETTAAAGLTASVWDDKFFVESIQENRFSSSMGKDENSIIQIKEDLSKRKGDTLHYALVNRLTGAGVADGATLEGNEESLDSRSFPLSINERANGVRSNVWDNQISSIDLRKAAKMALKTWALEDTRDRVIAALGSINGVAYGTATAGQRNTWLVDNADRTLFGAAVANGVSGVHATALATVDASADKLTTTAISLMKRMARTASPKIHPVQAGDQGRYYYTLYVPSLVMRDLKADTTITAAQREVSLQEQNNKLFKGGDLLWDGVIIKEIEDIAVLTGVGAAAIDVAPVYLCGAQAVGYGIASRWKSATETFDYGRKKGCAISEMGNFAKITFGSGAGDLTDQKDHGVFTGYFASVADA